jgi:DNA polymerase
MSGPRRYQELLEATIDYVEDLKSRGVRFIPMGLEQPEPGLSGAGQGLPAVGPEPAEAASALPSVSSSAPGQEPGRGVSAPAAAELSLFPEPPSPTTVSVDASVLTPETKAEAFAELHARASACVKCPHLASTRKNVVFGVGSIEADLMFVGEAPGADEDFQGEPFVGRAGELLTKIIQAMGLSRDQVYIGNILKCRPDTPGQRSGNRKPTAAEMQTCVGYLEAQIDLIQPKVLVALGATAVEGLLGKNVGITRLRGHWQMYRGIPLMPTYHPAYLLRNQAPAEKRKVWEDMLQVMEKLRLPISQKQRGYFLRK